jgi:hypothetical protein
VAEPVEYGRSSSRRGRRRRRLLAIVLLALSVGALWKWRERLSQAVSLQYCQWRCLHFQTPGDAVAYDSDHPRASILAARDPAFSGGPLGYGYYPEPLTLLARTRPGTFIQQVAFMHERVSPAGHYRLVLVGTPTDKAFSFQRQAIIPASWFGSPALPPLTRLADRINVDFDCDPLQDDSAEERFSSDRTNLERGRDHLLRTAFRVFVGQPDPKDASHFTIRYEVGAEQGIIDGWLGDDDAIRLQARGPWAVPPDAFRKAGKGMIVP